MSKKHKFKKTELTNLGRPWMLPSSQQTQVALDHYDRLQEITVNAILGDSKCMKLAVRILPFFYIENQSGSLTRL